MPTLALVGRELLALNNVTLPHAIRIADDGWVKALSANSYLAAGLNVHAGSITCAPVAQALGQACKPLSEVLN